ncbi:hypothetical protein LPJ59_003813, partial [Coemansia sp. RSA 2399]
MSADIEPDILEYCCLNGYESQQSTAIVPHVKKVDIRVEDVFEKLNDENLDKL